MTFSKINLNMNIFLVISWYFKERRKTFEDFKAYSDDYKSNLFLH